MEKPIISVEKLKVIYNRDKSNEVRALDGIDVKIYSQEYVVIYGHSGCGKSTLLYSMSGLQAPTEGDATIKGKKISKMTKPEKVELHQTGIGMIFQAFYLIPSLTILDNVCLPKVFRGGSESERKREGIKLLQRFGIVEQSKKFPGELSGGQKQRVSIARSLINNPEIIFADEPVGNLDSASAENVMQILKELNEIDKKTIILVTHNEDHLRYADRILYMKDGKLIKEEVRREKRPKETSKKISEGISETGEAGEGYEKIGGDLRLLMRSFKSLSSAQIKSVLVPFKTDQLMSHILSQLNREQIQTASAYLKEFLFGNIDIDELKEDLDLEYEKGGAGWNKKRVINFVERVRKMTSVSNIIIGGDEEKAVKLLAEYLVKFFELKLEDEAITRLCDFLKLRIENKIDKLELQKKLDISKIRGGVGLHKNIAEKIASEVEIIILLKLSSQ
jgi:putative ABC transport system ATP-binding protein